MHGRIPRLVLVAPMVAALAVTVAASGPAPSAGTETPALRSISSRLDGAVSTVLIEASEPVAYLTSQPDPLTVLVDLRNVTAGPLGGTPKADMLDPVGSVAVEAAHAPDGAPVARVRVNLERVAKHRVRSSRNTILVEVDRASTTKAANLSFGPTAPAPLRNAPESARAGVRAPATELRSVRVGKIGNGYAVTLTGNGPLVPASVAEARDLPPRVLLDFPAVSAAEGLAVTNVNTNDITRVRVAPNSKSPLVTRVVIDLVRKIPYTVETVGEELRILFRKAVEATALAAPAAAVTDAPGPEAAALTAVPGSAPVPVVAPPVAPAAVEPEPVTPAPVDAAPAAVVPGPGQVAPRATAATASAPAPLDSAGLRDLAVAALGRAGGPVVPEPAPAVVAATAPAPGASSPAPPLFASLAPVSVAPGPLMSVPVPVSAAQQAPSSGLTGNSFQQPNQGGQRQFTEDPVTLDFQGADLRAVLRTFAEISGLNIVIDPSIQGTVDVSLRDVPWDQALDIILRANKLGYSVEGNIVRIVPLTVLATENEERRKLSEAQALAGELRVLTRSVSYAKAADLVPVVTRSALSARGDVQVDARTNTLIIRDLADRLTAASELITTLDRPQPQVEIEARIVQLNRDKARDLGIQWNLSGKVDPALGTSTGLAFPSRAGVTAETGSVNSASPSAVGIVLGSINGALNLDVDLRALEREGSVKILSTPRVTTQNNIAAEITQGAQIPIQVVSNNTVTVTFKDAALTLRVTPQITASNTVIMNIFLENATPDYTETSAAQPIPAINTQRAVTSVLLADGDTTVIGGIYTKLEANQQTRTPFLHRVPLLGWLFKNDTRLDDNRELLIFITPRISK